MITQEIIYKQQGNGKDSWCVKTFDNGELISAEMVYENPNTKKIDISKIDIDTLTNDELVKLANRLKPHLK